ncbi:Uncharacterized protein R10E11.5 [Toxocara canis]|uniref:Uncharacterized protein R10E11.5 n=1 Tax=Toxocara canis TaxID=6265 RepID=A0A0B2VUG4_TOXCA|nr:Uncharacterized protein R10E11.5 [Toxocara canis]
MASSRGRSTVTERRERRTFVFGSSTPRDLSYMSKVPPTLRTYDSKPLKTPPLKKEETLTHYMRQARSLTPHLSGSIYEQKCCSANCCNTSLSYKLEHFRDNIYLLKGKPEGNTNRYCCIQKS